MAGTLAPLAQLVRQRPNDPTVVGGAVPCGSVSLVISSMAPAGGSAKQANHGQVALEIARAEGGSGFSATPTATGQFGGAISNGGRFLCLRIN